MGQVYPTLIDSFRTTTSTNWVYMLMSAFLETVQNPSNPLSYLDPRHRQAGP